MVMYKHAKQDAPSISELVDTVHPAMTHLVATLLQKDRARRPSSAATVIGYIDAIDWASDDVPVLSSESLDGSVPEDTERDSTHSIVHATAKPENTTEDSPPLIEYGGPKLKPIAPSDSPVPDDVTVASSAKLR